MGIATFHSKNGFVPLCTSPLFTASPTRPSTSLERNFYMHSFLFLKISYWFLKKHLWDFFYIHHNFLLTAIVPLPPTRQSTTLGRIFFINVKSSFEFLNWHWNLIHSFRSKYVWRAEIQDALPIKIEWWTTAFDWQSARDKKLAQNFASTKLIAVSFCIHNANLQV